MCDKRKGKPVKRSKRFTPEQNAQLDKVEIIEEEEGASATEQPHFGLGLQEKRITRSVSSQAKQQREFTLAPPTRSPGVLSQEALNVFVSQEALNVFVY